MGRNNCLIYGTERLIAAVGMEATAIIDTQDALMVCLLDQTHRVKEIVEELQRQAPKHLQNMNRSIFSPQGVPREEILWKIYKQYTVNSELRDKFDNA